MSAVLRPVAAIARYTALEALRTRFAWLVLVLVAGGFGIGAFAGELAITETSQTQAAIVAALLRFAAVLLLILFVTTSVNRDFSDKSVELMLSLPLPRAGYYLGKLGGYAVVAAFTAVPLVCLMLFFSPAASSLGWGVSLLLELLLVCGFSVLFAFALSQVTAAVAASLLIYLLARSIAAIQLLAQAPSVSAALPSQQLLSGLVDMLAYLLPDLDRFTRSDWLLYGAASLDSLAALAAQTGIYLALLSAVALFDLYRKNF